MSPSRVDTSTSDQTVTVTASITDDLSGVGNGGYIMFRSPSGQYVNAQLGEGWQVSGTPQNAVVSYPMTVPADSEPGTWTAQVLELDDRVGNRNRIVGHWASHGGWPPRSFCRTVG
jgi:hypothetical protein